MGVMVGWFMVLSATAALVACGSDKKDEAAEYKPTLSAAAGACASSALLGTWADVGGSAERVVFRDDCSGTEVLCGWGFVSSSVAASSGNVDVDVQTATQEVGHCPKRALLSCAYVLTNEAQGKRLRLTCPGADVLSLQPAT